VGSDGFDAGVGTGTHTPSWGVPGPCEPVDPRSAPFPLPTNLRTIDYPPGTVAVAVDAHGAPLPVHWPDERGGEADYPSARLLVPRAATQVLIPRFAARFRGTWLVASPVEDLRAGRRRWPFRADPGIPGRVEAYDLWPLVDSSASSAPMEDRVRADLGFPPLPPYRDSVRASVRRRWGNPVALRVATRQIEGLRLRVLTGERWQADDPVLPMTPGDGLTDLATRWAEIARLAGQGMGPAASWDPRAGRPRRSWPLRGNTAGLRSFIWEPFTGARPRESVLLTLDEGGRVLPRSRVWEKEVFGSVPPSDPEGHHLPDRGRGRGQGQGEDQAHGQGQAEGQEEDQARGQDTRPSGTGSRRTGHPTLTDPFVPGRRVIAAARPLLVTVREGWPLLAESGDLMPPPSGAGVGGRYRTYPIGDSDARPGPVPEDLLRRLHIAEWGRDGETYGTVGRHDVDSVYVPLRGVGPWASCSTTIDLRIGEDLADLMGRPKDVHDALARIARQHGCDA